MKVHITVVYEYEIPDGRDERLSLYGSMNPDYCVELDIENGIQEFSEFADVIHTEYRLIPE